MAAVVFPTTNPVGSYKYPLTPPIIYFKTKIFHPNIHLEKGEVCLDILKNNWKAVFNLNIVLDSLKDLLANPNPDSPLNCDAGNLFKYKPYY